MEIEVSGDAMMTEKRDTGEDYIEKFKLLSTYYEDIMGDLLKEECNENERRLKLLQLEDIMSNMQMERLKLEKELKIRDQKSLSKFIGPDPGLCGLFSLVQHSPVFTTRTYKYKYVKVRNLLYFYYYYYYSV